MNVNIHLPLKMKELTEEQRIQFIEQFSKALDVPAQVVPVEPLTAVISEVKKDEHNIWARNDEDMMAEAEEDFYQALVYPSLETMATLIAALGLSEEHIELEKSFSPEFLEYESTLLKAKDSKGKLSALMELTKQKRQAFLKYLQDGSSWTKTKLKQIEKILSQHLPDYAKLAEEYAVRAAFIAKVRNTADTEALEMTGAFVDRFPKTIEAARHENIVLTASKNTSLVITEAELEEDRQRRKNRALHSYKILPLQPQEVRTVEQAEMSTAEKLTEVSDKHRSAIKQVVIQAMKGRWSAQQLAQALFDQFGEQNRDWRRVAITELAMASNDAYLAGCADGDQVWVPPVAGACKWCVKYLEGKTFTVTTDPKLMGNNYDQEMKYVWAGKTNFGRKQAAWIPCIPLHPNCRHRFHKISRFYKVGEDGKPALKTATELIQEERARRGLPPDPNLK